MVTRQAMHRRACTSPEWMAKDTPAPIPAVQRLRCKSTKHLKTSQNIALSLLIPKSKQEDAGSEGAELSNLTGLQLEIHFKSL